MSAKKPKKISWWEPRWHYVPKLLRAWRTIFSPKCIRRCIVVTGGLVAGLALALKIWLPNLQFDWLGAFAKSVAVFASYMVFMLLALIAFPPSIEVNRRGIRSFHVQSGKIYKHDSISRVCLLVFSGRRMRLRIRLESGKSAHLGVSPKVDLNALEEFFGEKFSVRDCRRRTFGGHHSADKSADY